MFLSIFLSITVGVIVVPLSYWCLVLFKHRSLNAIPGPWAYPFLGSIFPKDPYEFYDVIMDLHRKHGAKFKLYLGPDLTVVFSRHENIETILSSNVQIEKSVNYKFIMPWVGEGLLISKGNKWKSRRKLITPAFHFKILNRFMKSFNIAGQELIRQLEKKVGNNSVDIFEYISYYTLDIICDTAMGVKLNAQTDRNQSFPRSVKQFLETLVYRLFTAYAQSDWMFRLNPKYPKYAKDLNILQDLTTKVIEERKTMYRIEDIKKDDGTDLGMKANYALLDLLLTTNNKDDEKLTDKDLRDEINTFMFAGHDTTTTGLSFTLLEIARHPEIQEKLYKEIVSTVGTETTDLTINDLSKLKYLDMVMKEALRMYPSVPLIQRKLVKDIWIDGLKYPKGVTITLAIFMLHYDPEFYPDPYKFDPERFTTENMLKRPAYAYVPFSAGPRNCIGQKFAIYEMKSAIIKILQNFKLLSVLGFKEELGFMAILKPKGGIPISLERREKIAQITHV